MTVDEQSRTDLVKYRMERADETLQEARLLAKEGYYNAAFNRLYYASMLRWPSGRCIAAVGAAAGLCYVTR